MKRSTKKLLFLSVFSSISTLAITACTDNVQTTSLTSNNPSPNTNSNTQSKDSDSQEKNSNTGGDKYKQSTEGNPKTNKKSTSGEENGDTKEMGEKSENSKITSPSSTTMHDGSTSKEGKTGPGSTTSPSKVHVVRSEPTDGSEGGGDNKVGTKKEAEGSAHESQVAQNRSGINQAGKEGKRVAVAPEHGSGSGPESKVTTAVPTATGNDGQKNEPGASDTEQNSSHVSPETSTPAKEKA